MLCVFEQNPVSEGSQFTNSVEFFIVCLENGSQCSSKLFLFVSSNTDSASELCDVTFVTSGDRQPITPAPSLSLFLINIVESSPSCHHCILLLLVCPADRVSYEIYKFLQALQKKKLMKGTGGKKSRRKENVRFFYTSFIHVQVFFFCCNHAPTK